MVPAAVSHAAAVRVRRIPTAKPKEDKKGSGGGAGDLGPGSLDDAGASLADLIASLDSLPAGVLTFAGSADGMVTALQPSAARALLASSPLSGVAAIC